MQVIVPFFILLIECWLRFGWNSEAIPQISHQPLLDTDIDDDGDFETTGFIWSSLAKLMLGSLNALTFLLAGSIVNQCSDMEFEAAFVWVLRHYHEVLVGEPGHVSLLRTRAYSRSRTCISSDRNSSLCYGHLRIVVHVSTHCYVLALSRLLLFLYEHFTNNCKRL